MPATTYQGIYGAPFAFTFTPSGSGGTAFGSEQAQAEEATPHETKIETAKYTPISGTNSGIEQIALTKVAAQEYKIKCTYGNAEHTAALACLVARSAGTLVAIYADTHTDTFVNALLTGVHMSSSNSTATITDDLTFSVIGLPTFA
jgi:hypothetical protein